MSATTAVLMEQIVQLEQNIKRITEQEGEDSPKLRPLQEDLMYSQRELSLCNKALSESRQILKG